MSGDCAWCGHEASGHCKGGVTHGHHGDTLREAKYVRVTVCTTRHCQEPLCCCVAYVEAGLSEEQIPEEA